MSYHLTITLFAPVTDDERKVTVGLSFAITLADFPALHKLADLTHQTDAINRLIHDPMVETVLIDTRDLRKVHYQPDQSDHLADAIRPKDRLDFVLGENGYSASDCQTLRSLFATLHIVSPQATMQLKERP